MYPRCAARQPDIVPPRPAWAMGLVLLRQAGFEPLRDLAHVGLAGKPGLEQRHGLAHGLGASGAGFSDRRSDRGIEIGLGHLLSM